MRWHMENEAKAIPAEWLAQLELGEVIEEIATDLYEFSYWPLFADCINQEEANRINQKYPGH